MASELHAPGAIGPRQIPRRIPGHTILCISSISDCALYTVHVLWDLPRFTCTCCMLQVLQIVWERCLWLDGSITELVDPVQSIIFFLHPLEKLEPIVYLFEPVTYCHFWSDKHSIASIDLLLEIMGKKSTRIESFSDTEEGGAKLDTRVVWATPHVFSRCRANVWSRPMLWT